MVNGKWNCCASYSSTKLFLAMLPLILVAVFGIVSIISPKEIKEVVRVVNDTHSANFNHSSSTIPFPDQAIQTPQQSVEQNETEVLNISKHCLNSTISLNETEVLNISKPWVNSTNPLNEMEVFNISKPWLNNTDPLNETYVPSPRIKQQRKFNILDRTEAGLLQARIAIREAINSSQTQDSDYVPIGPMYWNAKAFHRNYFNDLDPPQRFALLQFLLQK